MATSATQPHSLRDLLPEATVYPAWSNPTVWSVTTDAGRTTPGSLYVHLDEFDASGAELAASRGAAAVIAERLLPAIDVPLVVVDDIRAAHTRLREALALTTRETELLVVGGSVGRSVTAGLLSRIVTAQDRSHTSRATAVVVLTPELRCEPSNPRVACLTSLRTDGLTTAGERRWDSVAAHRKSIEQSIGGLNNETILVANADDPNCLAFASRHSGPVLTYGEHPDSDVVIIELESSPGGQEFLIGFGSESAAISVATPGAAYRSNCVAAITTALAVGVGLETCVRSIELAPKPYGMLEPIARGQDFPIVLDRANRPLALRVALKAAKPAGGGRLIAVIRLSSDAAVAAEQLATASKLADRVIALAAAAEPAIRGAPNNASIVDDRVAAIAIAVGLADSGDAVIIAGCETGELARDRELVRHLVERRLACSDAAAAA